MLAHRRVVRLVLVTFVGACAPAPGDYGSEHDPVAVVEDDLIADHWELARELTIGGAEEGPASFSEIKMVTVDGNGRIYVLDSKEHDARLFGADGTFIRRFGGWGEGPAEFQNPNGIMVDRLDRVWVYVPRLHRVVHFDSSGAFVRTRPHQYTSVGYRMQGGIDPEFRFVTAELVREDTSYIWKMLRIDWDREQTTTLDWPDCGAVHPGGYQLPRGSMEIPFRGGVFERLDSRGYTWCADAGVFRIHQYRLGDSVPIQTLEAEATAVPVTQAERDSVIAIAEDFKRRAGPAELDYSLIPATKPILVDLAMDDRGRVWVMARTAEGLRLFGFTAGGRSLGSAPVPFAVHNWGPPIVVRNGRLHAVTLDEDDVPRVEVYRIQPRP